MTSLLADLAKIDHVTSVSDPYTQPGSISKSGEVALSNLQLDEQSNDIDTSVGKQMIEVGEQHSTDGLQVYLGGHSYGGRMASMAAAEYPGLATAMLFLSYPLHPPGKPERLRTEHFPRLRPPCVFVSGTADPFGTPDELRASTDPTVRQFIDGTPDGPFRFHYPGTPLEADFGIGGGRA